MLLGLIVSTITQLNTLFVFFPIQRYIWHSDIMVDKGLNLFDECAAECMLWTVKCTHLAPWQIHKGRQKKWCYCQSKNFSGTSDTISNLKTFKIISNEMPVLLLILRF